MVGKGVAMVRLSHVAYYDPGNPNRPEEDIIVCGTSVFGVMDVCGPLACSSHPTMKFGRLSGGQAVSAAIRPVFIGIDRETPLKEVLITADQAVGEFKKANNIKPGDDANVLGAVFALGKVCEDKVRIATAGDCTAVVFFKNGSSMIIWNSNFLPYEMGRRKERTKLRKDDLFYLYLLDCQKANANRNYPVIDGCLNLDLVRFDEFPTEEVDVVATLSDGFLPQEDKISWEEKTMETVRQVLEGRFLFAGVGGFRGVLKQRRRANFLNCREKLPEASLLFTNF